MSDSKPRKRLAVVATGSPRKQARICATRDVEELPKPTIRMQAKDASDIPYSDPGSLAGMNSKTHPTTHTFLALGRSVLHKGSLNASSKPTMEEEEVVCYSISEIKNDQPCFSDLEREIASSDETDSSDEEEEDPSLNRVSWDHFLRFTKCGTVEGSFVLYPENSSSPIRTIPQREKEQRPKLDGKPDRPNDIKSDDTDYLMSKRKEEEQSTTAKESDQNIQPEAGSGMATDQESLADVEAEIDANGPSRPEAQQQLEGSKSKRKPVYVDLPICPNSFASYPCPNEQPEPSKGMPQNLPEEKQDQPGESPWETRFSELVSYKNLFGHANPPQSKHASDADYKLAVWLSQQRFRYSKGKLALEKAQKLKDLGCSGFDINPYKEQQQQVQSIWERRFMELVAYKDQNGHANPPRTKGKDKYKLSTWLEGQRKAHREGKLTLEKTQKLKDLGCRGFDADSEQHPQVGQAKIPWETRFLELLAYKDQKGHANPPQSQKNSDVDSKLARWLKDQRYACKKGKLAPQRLQKLKDLGCSGFDPDPKKKQMGQAKTPWELRFKELIAYKDQNGHANPPRSKLSSTADLRLSEWLKTQRHAHREGKLALEKLQKLKDLGCSGFDADSEQHPSVGQAKIPWETRFLELLAYKDQKGHANPPLSKKSSDADYKLAVWLRDQRYTCKKGNLVMEKLQKLKDLGCFGFDPDSEKKQHQQVGVLWETRFLELLAYKDQRGHANPPQSKKSSDADYKLAVWLRDQRQAHREGRLALERLQKLKDLGCSGFDPDSKMKQCVRLQTSQLVV